MRYASVCDGIGAVHVAWKPLGWDCAWTSEIEPFPAAVVEHHFGYANVGDMTKITEEMLREHGPVDLLAGGTPCQSFSVAGLRGGLADPRGNLALRFVQLATVMQPKWIVWENVPGVLSSGKGRDFGTFLGALGELGYGFAYRVLDAQWFGVAQRRRRVFVVGYLGDWRRAAAVLFERESVFGNPPTRGAKGQGTASGFADGSGGGLAKPLGSHDLSKGRGTDLDNTTYVAFHPTQDPISSMDGSTHSMGCGSKGGCCTQAVAFQSNLGSHGGHVFEDGTSPTVRVGSGLGIPSPSAVAFTKSKRAQSTTDDQTWVPGEVSPTMSCFDQGDTRATTVVAQGFTYSGYSNQPALMTGDRTDCLPASGHSDGSHQGVGVAIGFDGFQSGNPKATHQATEEGTGPLIRNRPHCVATPMAVRRLTPRECERLQGFPDDYTLVEYRKKPAADGPRYRALGNSMAVPVMRWIGERIAMVEGIQ